jgi:vacuolar protein sorting-associated protein 41
MVLRKMLEEVEDMRGSGDQDAMGRLMLEAEGHFLNTLLAWGTTRTLKEHIKLFEYQSNLDVGFDSMVRHTTERLNHRYEQTAVGYLDRATDRSSVPTQVERRPARNENIQDSPDSLYNIDDLIAVLAQRISVIKKDASNSTVTVSVDSARNRDSRVALDALAKLYMMKGRYDEALKFFLVLGAMHSSKSLVEIEDDALSMVNEDPVARDGYLGPYSFVLYLIETYHLQQSLLEAKFLPADVNSSPICALVRLVGLELMGDFLIEHCIAPQQKAKVPSNSTLSYYTPGPASVKTSGERRGTLPLDLVADQLSGSPKLFYWYLHLVFVRKPEIYVKFPTTANPPPVITNLHKKHLDLYIKYAGPNRDSARALAGVEAYRVVEKTTPLLSFLKAILQLGAIGPVEVGKMLEIERRGGAGVSRTFALELAYIMENYGDDSESDADLILELYLKGAQSLMLAVSYAQRAKSHSAKLWKALIDHCLSRSPAGEKSEETTLNGILFGSLLEAAALSGADLAHLVAQIPPGMQVEGLRPRLVAAVADYRLNVQLHSTSTEIAVDEKSLLFQEVAQRSRRGMRFDGSNDPLVNARDSAGIKESRAVADTENISETHEVLSPRMRTRDRPSRYNHSFSIAIR